jgi:hypothetical protein
LHAATAQETTMAKKTTPKTTTAKTKASPAATASAATKPAAKRQKAPTTHKLIWRDTTCRVKHTPNYLSPGWTHIEITVVSPKGAPLPITGTGYRSHFLDEELLAAAGGPVAFFQRWIEQEATTKAWAKVEFKWRQLELFPRSTRP